MKEENQTAIVICAWIVAASQALQTCATTGLIPTPEKKIEISNLRELRNIPIEIHGNIGTTLDPSSRVSILPGKTDPGTWYNPLRVKVENPEDIRSICISPEDKAPR